MTTNPDSVPEFSLLFVELMGRLHPAVVSTERMDDVASFLAKLRLAQDEFDCVAKLAQPYAKSNVQPIATSADGVIGAAEVMSQWTRQVFELVQRAVDNEIGAGARAARLADLVSLKKNTLEMLPMAAVALTHAFPAKGTSPERPLIVLTEVERRAILQRLSERVGVHTGPKAGPTYPQAACSLLYKFLSNKGWHSTPRK